MAEKMFTKRSQFLNESTDLQELGFMSKKS